MGHRNRRRDPPRRRAGSRSLFALGVSVCQGGNVRTEQDGEANKLLDDVDDPFVVARWPHPPRLVEFLERLRNCSTGWRMTANKVATRRFPIRGRIDLDALTGPGKDMREGRAGWVVGCDSEKWGVDQSTSGRLSPRWHRRPPPGLVSVENDPSETWAAQDCCYAKTIASRFACRKFLFRWPALQTNLAWS